MNKEARTEAISKEFNAMLKGSDGCAYLCEAISESEQGDIDALRNAVINNDVSTVGRLYLNMIDRYVGESAAREVDSREGL
jgi:hypothetical protein